MILDLLGVCSTLQSRPQLLAHMPGWLQRWETAHTSTYKHHYKCLFLPNVLSLLQFSQTFLLFVPQMVQREEVSKACDVYSYGMLLFEIATRQVPFPDVGPVMAAVMTMDGKVGHSEDTTHFREYPYTVSYIMMFRSCLTITADELFFCGGHF